MSLLLLDITISVTNLITGLGVVVVIIGLAQTASTRWISNTITTSSLKLRGDILESIGNNYVSKELHALQLSTIDTKFSTVNQNMANMDHRHNNLSTRQTHLQEQINTFERQLVNHTTLYLDGQKGKTI